VGIDIARALAIVGMMMVHVGPTTAEGTAGRLYAFPHGRASLLFVLVAGVGVSLLGRSRSTGPRRFRLSLAWRAAVLLPLGLVLQLLDHNVNVILQTFAALFLIGMVAHLLSDRWLLLTAGATAVIGPSVYLWGELRWPETFRREPMTWGDPAGEILHELVLTGPYPLVAWSAPLLIGMWIGRQDLRSREFATRLLVVGGVVAVATMVASDVATMTFAGPDAPQWLQSIASRAPHSQMPLWLVNGTAVAAAVLGALLLLIGAPTRWSGPWVSAGQLALTIYVAHLIVLDAAPDLATSGEVGPATVRVAVATAVMLAFSHVWRAVMPHGPLEVFLRLPGRIR